MPFLILHILTNHLCIKTYRINTVPIRPEMIAPIGLYLQIRKLLECLKQAKGLLLPKINERQLLPV